MNSLVQDHTGIIRKMDFNHGWTLFLDRDGVINRKIENSYVTSWADFNFLPEVPKAIALLTSIFDRILVVTNQRGVGKGIMTEEQLNFIHNNMCEELKSASGKIDKIYYCIDVLESSECRKPNIGMGLQAKIDFPEIDFKKSIIIGDSLSDMAFGKGLGMICFYINENSPENATDIFDLRFDSLFDCSVYLAKQAN